MAVHELGRRSELTWRGLCAAVLKLKEHKSVAYVVTTENEADICLYAVSMICGGLGWTIESYKKPDRSFVINGRLFQVRHFRGYGFKGYLAYFVLDHTVHDELSDDELATLRGWIREASSQEPLPC